MCSIGKVSFGQTVLRCHHHFVSKVQHRPYQIASKSLTTLKQLICQQISFSNTRRWQKIDEQKKLLPLELFCFSSECRRTGSRGATPSTGSSPKDFGRCRKFYFRFGDRIRRVRGQGGPIL